MLRCKKTLFQVVLFMCAFGMVQSLVAQPGLVTKVGVNVDQLFQNLDVEKLIGTDMVLNVHAQMQDPEATTTNIADFNRFIALGFHEPATVITEFDANQQVLSTYSYPQSWVGVRQYQPRELATLNVTIQQGFKDVQACMPMKLSRIARVVIYKSLGPDSQFVYDYVFSDPHLVAGTCREWLYLPASGTCSQGMVVNCHFNPELKAL